MPKLTADQWDRIAPDFERGARSPELARKWRHMLNTSLKPATIRVHFHKEGVRGRRRHAEPKINWDAVFHSRMEGVPEDEIVAMHAGLTKRRYRDYAAKHAWPEDLSPIEAEIYRMWGGPKTVEEIAAAIDRHVQTVFYYRRKLCLPNRPRGRRRAA